MLLALLLSSGIALFWFVEQVRSRCSFQSSKHIGSRPTKWPSFNRGVNTKISKHSEQSLGITASEADHSTTRTNPQETLSNNNGSLPPLCSHVSPRMTTPTPKRIVVAMTGATGSVLGVELLRALRRMNIETHLVISKWAAATLAYETDYTVKDLRALAYKTYSAQDVAASISSGSFWTQGMIIVPCSMKTLSAVANGYGDDLITRAADVTLKERRKLVVVARETPLTGIHLHNMATITSNGGIIFPPVPAFYTKPTSVDDIIKQSVGRMLDMFDVDSGDFERWSGF